jgi:hypothetical protein
MKIQHSAKPVLAELNVSNQHRYTRFFHLVPRETGSILHESLPSYVDSLAGLHAVSVQPFVRKAICESAGWTGVDPNAHIPELLVGYGDAGRVIDFISAETAAGDLAQVIHPLLRDHSVLKLDLRRTSAWCPACLSDWAKKNLRVYRPLIWSISFVTYCPVHRAEILTRCPSCREQIEFFSLTPWNGHCPSCGSWLGLKSDTGTVQCQPTHFESSCISRIGELLLSRSQPPSINQTNIFKENVDTAVKAVGVNEFCRITKFSKRNIQSWRKVDRKPQLVSLLRLSYCFALPLNDLVFKRMTTADFGNRQVFDRCRPS